MRREKLAQIVEVLYMYNSGTSRLYFELAAWVPQRIPVGWGIHKGPWGGTRG